MPDKMSDKLKFFIFYSDYFFAGSAKFRRIRVSVQVRR